MRFIDLVYYLHMHNAEFFPYYPEYPYKRTTAKVSVNEGVKATFIPNPDLGYLVDDIVFNLDRLNISVRTVVKGTVHIPDAPLFGMPADYPTHIYRTFTFIKDGEIHYKTMVVKVTEEFAEKLTDLGIVQQLLPDGRIVIDVSRCQYVPNVPFTPIDRSWFSANHVVEAELAARVKVFKHYYSLVKPRTSEEPSNFEEGVQRLLADNYIKPDGSFSPPSSVSEEVEDSGPATTLEVKIKGLSSLPSIASLEKKLNSNKKLTMSESLLHQHYLEVQYKMTYNNNELAEILLTELKKAKRQLLAVRSEIIFHKLQLMTAYPWFDSPADMATCNPDELVEQWDHGD